MAAPVRPQQHLPPGWPGCTETPSSPGGWCSPQAGTVPLRRPAPSFSEGQAVTSALWAGERPSRLWLSGTGGRRAGLRGRECSDSQERQAGATESWSRRAGTVQLLSECPPHPSPAPTGPGPRLELRGLRPLLCQARCLGTGGASPVHRPLPPPPLTRDPLPAARWACAVTTPPGPRGRAACPSSHSRIQLGVHLSRLLPLTCVYHTTGRPWRCGGYASALQCRGRGFEPYSGNGDPACRGAGPEPVSHNADLAWPRVNIKKKKNNAQLKKPSTLEATGNRFCCVVSAPRINGRR